MAGKRIYDTDPSKSLSPLSGAGSANDDKFVVFDTSEGVTKRMDRSQVAIGLVGDLPYTPSGGISATTIPTAIAELDSEAAKSAALAASGGSSLVGHIASGTGATARTVQAKLRDTVSVKDFGAVDGQDISAAVTKAVNYLNARGGGVLDFSGIVATCSATTFSGVSNITFDGAGAKISKPAGSGANSLIFNFKGGCQEILIKDFGDLDGGYDGSVNPTTGTSPVILIGDQLGSGDGGSTNRNITIRNNKIRRGNWAGIMIYGRSGTGGTPTPLNENIRVYDNEISLCSNGVFTYKNGKNIRIVNNDIHDVGYDGVIFDTMAATDTVVSEAIVGAICTGNKIDKFGMYGFGVGVLFKGAVSMGVCSLNQITNGMVNAQAGLTNYAVSITNDSNPTPSAPQRLSVTYNVIDTVNSSQANGGYGVFLGGVSSEIDVNYNKITGTTNHAILVGPGASDVNVIGNAARKCGVGIYAFRFEAVAGNTIKRLNVIGNRYNQAGGSATGGFYVNYVDGAFIRDNRADDFTTTAQVASNATSTFGSRQFSGTAAPTAGTYRVGDIFWNTSPTFLNPVTHWTCTVGGTPGTWKPGGWIVTKASTASRPSLRADDVGVNFMDTTLNANGKPIWWNGAAWVDSTGASV